MYVGEYEEGSERQVVRKRFGATVRYWISRLMMWSQHGIHIFLESQCKNDKGEFIEPYALQFRLIMPTIRPVGCLSDVGFLSELDLARARFSFCSAIASSASSSSSDSSGSSFRSVAIDKRSKLYFCMI